jgi:DNA polymerase-3 subunit alpha
MAKSTKTLKNGDTMAFITLEDSLGEIEVVVFAKIYAKYKDELELESGVLAEGRLSVDDNDAPKLLLSKLSRLLTNGDFDRSSVDTDRVRADVSAKVGGRLFIKVPDLSEKVTAPILRLSSLNPGTLEVILYDSSSGKYTKMKNITVSSDEKLIDRLKARFGKDNVVIKE